MWAYRRMERETAGEWKRDHANDRAAKAIACIDNAWGLLDERPDLSVREAVDQALARQRPEATDFATTHVLAEVGAGQGKGAESGDDTVRG